MSSSEKHSGGPKKHSGGPKASSKKHLGGLGNIEPDQCVKKSKKPVEKHRGFCGAEFDAFERFCGAEECEHKGVTYCVFGKEVCPHTGNNHLQFFVYFKNAKTIAQAMKWVKKNWTFTRPVDPMQGTPKQAADYCKKDGDWTEWGVLPEKGKRGDLDEVKEQVMSGEVTVDELAESDPMIVHQYGRVLDRIEDIANRKKVRTEMTKGIWIHGPTGCGKSHDANELAKYGSVYWHNCSDKGWWDGYTGQDTVILNDYRGGIAYGELLQMVDKWPYTVPRRGRQPMPFTSKTVIVTSSLPPAGCYKNLAAEDSLKQLERRFEIREIEICFSDDED